MILAVNDESVVEIRVLRPGDSLELLKELALDTAEPAAHLIDWYQRLGFALVGHWKWGGANYRSVLMSKNLRQILE
jgi:hypothetical protein